MRIIKEGYLNKKGRGYSYIEKGYRVCDENNEIAKVRKYVSEKGEERKSIRKISKYIDIFYEDEKTNSFDIILKNNIQSIYNYFGYCSNIIVPVILNDDRIYKYKNIFDENLNNFYIHLNICDLLLMKSVTETIKEYIKPTLYEIDLKFLNWLYNKSKIKGSMVVFGSNDIGIEHIIDEKDMHNIKIYHPKFKFQKLTDLEN